MNNQSKTQLEKVCDLSAIVLMIIDVQRAMFECDGGVYHGNEVLGNIQQLLSSARQAHMPIVFIQHTEENSEYDRAAETWAIHPNLKPLDSEPVVEKNYADAFYKTDLESVFNKMGIRKVIVVGMQTEYCMDTTIRNGFSRGYELFGVRGCHTTFDSSLLKASEIIGHHESIWDGRFLKLLTLEEAKSLILSQEACEK